MIKILIFIAFCVLFKFQYNYLKYRKALKLKNKYQSWVNDENSVPDIATYQHEITSLLKNAKVKDLHVPITQKIGFGKIATSTCSVIENMLSGRSSISKCITDMLDMAIGYYRAEYKKAFNPLYWIETIVFLPKSLIEYVGVDSEKSSARLLNIILTGLWWLIVLFVTCFKSEIINLIQSFLQKLA